MTSKLRTVFDSNIYVAAALRPGQYADRWLDIAFLPNSGLELFVSPAILDEVENKLTDRFGFKKAAVQRLIRRITAAATLIEPDLKLDVVRKDSDDNRILECAVAAKAHLIVSADKHLLDLGGYKRIGIAHPRELKNIFAADYKQ